MAWITLTTAMVLEEFSSQELAALDAAKGASALEGILGRVTALVRGAVRAGGYALGEGNTIPEALAADAVAIARWHYLISLPKNELLQSEPRRKAHEDALNKLRLVETQACAVESPTEAANGTGNWNSENKLVMRTHPVPNPSAQDGADTGDANPDAPPDR